jgi:hypothetical protein
MVSRSSMLAFRFARRLRSPASPSPRCTTRTGRRHDAEKFAARQVPPDREPVGELQRYGRMLRPFPTRRLVDALYHVEAEGAALTRVLQNLLIEPPQTAEPWSEALYYVLDCLDGICERAIEARPQIERMIDTADVDAERAAVALRALTGLAPC